MNKNLTTLTAVLSIAFTLNANTNEINCSDYKDLSFDADYEYCAAMVDLKPIVVNGYHVSKEVYYLDIPAEAGTDAFRLEDFQNLPVGHLEVVWNYTDKAGHKTQCKQNVEIVDRMIPKIECSSSKNTTVFTTEEYLYGEEVLEKIPAKYAMDNCTGIIKPTYSRVDGSDINSKYEVGHSYLFDIVYEDESGNKATCRSEVKIERENISNNNIGCANTTKTQDDQKLTMYK